jgi:hypothetical protein
VKNAEKKGNSLKLNSSVDFVATANNTADYQETRLQWSAGFFALNDSYMCCETLSYALPLDASPDFSAEPSWASNATGSPSLANC